RHPARTSQHQGYRHDPEVVRRTAPTSPNQVQWRTLIDWDSGPEINPGNWKNNCRVNVSGRPDEYCGKTTSTSPR
ncbi:hypothetical protein ACIPY6_43055, partial [Streptomyces sp. NPDC090054]|uniref:hypothetical protein n=1 Tax=Streptomyces sp. NPDC090054 TaxID=3365933 RepID=UPI00380011E2